MEKSKVIWFQVDDRELSLIIRGKTVEFAATPEGVFDATGKKVGTGLEEFLLSLGIQARDADPKRYRPQVDWFRSKFPDIAPAPPPRFDGNAFLQQRQIMRPDSTVVSSAEEAREQGIRITQATEEARAAGAQQGFLDMLGRWSRGWRAVVHRYEAPSRADTMTEGKGASPEALRKRAEKRQRDQAVRQKMRGGAGRK